MTAPLATAYGCQYLPSGLLWEVQVYDYKIRAVDRLRNKGMNELDCHLPIAQNHQFAIHAVLFERFTHQARIGGIVFCEKDKSGSCIVNVAAGFLRAGL